jgi:hypothetical protein
MQSWRLPLILSTICLLVLLSIIFFESHQAGTADKIIFEKRLFPRFDPSTAYRITTRSRKQSDFRLVLENGHWLIQEPFKFTADNFAIDDLLWLLADIEYLQKISVKRDSSQLKQYGLNEPRFVLRANWGRKDEIELRIGSDSPRPGSVYAQIRKNDDDIYVISNEILSILSRPLDEWRNKTLINLADQEVHGIVLEIKGVRYEIGRINQDWKVITPETAELDPAKVNTWLGNLLSARAESYGDDALQDAARRIEPDSHVILELYNEKKELIAGLRITEVSTAADTSKAIARRVGENIWMCLEENQKPLLVPELDSLRDRRIMNIPTSAISKIAILRQDKTISFLRSNNGWILENYPHALETSLVEDYLTSLSQISFGESLKSSEKNTGEKFLSVNFWHKLESGQEVKTREIQILKSQDDEFICHIVGNQRSFKINREDVQKFLVEPIDFRKKKFVWPDINKASVITIENKLKDLKITLSEKPELLKFSQLLREVDVEKWIDIPNCPDSEAPAFVVTAEYSEKNKSSIQICQCEGMPSLAVFTSSDYTESFKPLTAWFSLFQEVLDQHIDLNQLTNTNTVDSKTEHKVLNTD